MEQLLKKYENIDKANQRLEEAVEYFKEQEEIHANHEYTKAYLEEKKLLPETLKTPRDSVREGTAARLYDEEDAQKIMHMISYRNMTAYRYKEALADEIASKIPQFHITITKILEKLKP